MALTYSMLGAFMLLLALLPMSIAWRDARQRARHVDRLAALRHDARLHAELRRRAPAPAPEWNGAGR